MSQKNYSGSIALTKLQSAIITTKKGARCILIPIEENYLTEKDGAIYLNCGVVSKDESDQYGNHGFISQRLSSEKYKELGEVAKDLKLPILGNIRNFQNSGNDNAGVVQVSQESINPEVDDLPF